MENETQPVKEVRKVTLNESIIIGALILGIAIFGVQYSKQKSIEAQQLSEILEEQRIEAKEESKRNEQERYLESCLNTAERDYWSFIKLNGVENEDGSVTASDYFWKTGKADKKVAEDNCYKKYK